MALLLHDIHQRFRGTDALVAVHLHVQDGDCYGFIGHNGAGKTTAIRIALGLLKPRRGRAILDGHDVRNPRVRRIVGSLIERPGFHDHRSGPANLAMLAGLQGIPARERSAEVARVLNQVGLGDVGRKRVGHYSQGMRQRLGLAAALLGHPRYLLLDEPTNGLDPQGIHELHQLLDGLRRDAGVTILLSSHLLVEVADLCNRIGVLHQGRMLTQAATADLLAGGVDGEVPRTAFLLTTDQPEAATRLLTADDQAQVEPQGTVLRVLPRDPATTPAQVVAELVHAGIAVTSFTPEPTTLAQLYLSYAEGRRRPDAPPPAPPIEPKKPLLSEGRVAGHLAATRRIASYELRRLLRPGPLLALVLPAVLAPLVVYQRFLGLAIDQTEIADGTLQSATGVTAFEALGRALTSTLPLLALILAGLASQSLAGELRSGTLRNILVRPFHRTEVALGKLLVLLGVALGAFGLLLASAATAAGWAFDYGDLVELLATGQTYEHLKADEVWPELWPALASPLVPLLGFTALGFLCGSLARSAAGALGFTLSLLVALELGRAFARAYHFENLLLGPYLPSPLTRKSLLGAFVDFAGGVNNGEQIELTFAVPAVWCLSCAVFSVLVFRRRAVT